MNGETIIYCETFDRLCTAGDDDGLVHLERPTALGYPQCRLRCFEDVLTGNARPEWIACVRMVNDELWIVGQMNLEIADTVGSRFDVDG